MLPLWTPLWPQRSALCEVPNFNPQLVAPIPQRAAIPTFTQHTLKRKQPPRYKRPTNTPSTLCTRWQVHHLLLTDNQLHIKPCKSMLKVQYLTRLPANTSCTVTCWAPLTEMPGYMYTPIHLWGSKRVFVVRYVVKTPLHRSLVISSRQTTRSCMVSVHNQPRQRGGLLRQTDDVRFLYILLRRSISNSHQTQHFQDPTQ